MMHHSLVFIFFNLLLKTVVSFCPQVLTVDITEGSHFSDKSIRKYGVLFDESNYFQMASNNETQFKGCICNFKSCIRKCCARGEIMVGKKCVFNNSNLKIPIYREKKLLKYAEETLVLIENSECDFGQTLLTPWLFESDRLYVQDDGSLYLPYFEKETLYKQEDFCVDVFKLEGGEEMLSVLICNKNDALIEAPPTFYSVGKLKFESQCADSMLLSSFGSLLKPYGYLLSAHQRVRRFNVAPPIASVSCFPNINCI